MHICQKQGQCSASALAKTILTSALFHIIKWPTPLLYSFLIAPSSGKVAKIFLLQFGRKNCKEGFWLLQHVFDSCLLPFNLLWCFHVKKPKCLLLHFGHKNLAASSRAISQQARKKNSALPVCFCTSYWTLDNPGQFIQLKKKPSQEGG